MGFRKSDPERWEFSNEHFIKDQKHLLKNIHRRKPIHSHSHPPSGSLLPDPERIALEEEIEKLSRDKADLSASLWRFRQQQSGTEIQLEDLDRRLYDMEQRQAKMIAFLERALHNPKFVENLIKMAGSGASPGDFSILHKKRRLPGVDYRLEIADNSFYDDDYNGKDGGQVFSRDFCEKLKLGLCPTAISESNNLITTSIQSSNEAGESPRVEQSRRLECLTFVPETLELSDTGTSLCPRKNSLLSGSVDDGDGLISCHLNLTLASSSMQIDKGDTLGRSHYSDPEEGVGDKEEDTIREATKSQSNAAAATSDGKAASLPDAAQTSNQGPPATTKRVNDGFWEQFLTERPGSSDTEEASSSLRTDHCNDPQEERKTVNDSMWKNRKDMEQLTL
ncbi:uncharacterized protein A4U43_C02F16760 [Asparagus officinalis]|uniref:HSF-type DNA-binding domain-containing protein n=1 Tax=Asparagus officinalis TaxID=4686 RepID=A0A5P1FKN8_ASPOF|nr:uncharacterized protein A4U43_C02F16760 [Asparagus officinalis]